MGCPPSSPNGLRLASGVLKMGLKLSTKFADLDVLDLKPGSPATQLQFLTYSWILEARHPVQAVRDGRLAISGALAGQVQSIRSQYTNSIVEVDVSSCHLQMAWAECRNVVRD